MSPAMFLAFQIGLPVAAGAVLFACEDLKHKRRAAAAAARRSQLELIQVRARAMRAHLAHTTAKAA